jgi:N-carbamoylputrescine amidase
MRGETVAKVARGLLARSPGGPPGCRAPVVPVAATARCPLDPPVKWRVRTSERPGERPNPSPPRERSGNLARMSLPENRTARIALIQIEAGDDKTENVRRTLERIAEAAQRGARIVCLQELFASRYFCQVEEASRFDLAEPLDGPTMHALKQAARANAVTIVASLFERRAPGLFHNTAVILGPDGGSLGLYRKMHIPDDPQYYEKFYFTPGDTGFIAVPTPEATIGPLVCWDQWYPEAARLTSLSGAEILVYPTAIGWLPEDEHEVGSDQRDAWRTIQRSHAIANGVFVAAVNRVGREPGPAGSSIRFWGSSFVCDPYGKVIAEAGSDEEILFADCDLALVDRARRAWPFLRDRRIDAYGQITQRWLR